MRRMQKAMIHLLSWGMRRRERLEAAPPRDFSDTMPFNVSESSLVTAQRSMLASRCPGLPSRIPRPSLLCKMTDSSQDPGSSAPPQIQPPIQISAWYTEYLGQHLYAVSRNQRKVCVPFPSKRYTCAIGQNIDLGHLERRDV